MLEECDIQVLPATDRAEARKILRAQPPVQVVLSAVQLPDGEWCNLLEDVVQSQVNAELVVCAWFADANLWCDTLQRGAYDLLVEPYYKREVQRIVEAAAARRRVCVKVAAG